MMMFSGFLKDAKHMLHPHFILNFMLASSFFFLKCTPGICEVLFEDCHLEMREFEMLTFLGCVLVMKTRKGGSTRTYISTLCMFAKCLSVVMFFRQNPVYGIIYTMLCILHVAFLPEPVYSGPDKVVFFRSESFMDEVVNGDKRIVWLVEMYAAWSPACVNLAPVFAEISNQYGLDNLKFGKIDVARYTNIAEKYKIDTSSWSRHLPTIVMIEHGKESMRRPFTDSRGKTLKFVWTKENIIRDFSLGAIYDECKKNPLPTKKAKQS